MSINKHLTLLAALFFSGLGHFKNWQRGSGTQMRTDRTPGERKSAGTKLGRMAEEHRLDGTNQDSVVSRAFRNEKINRNLARFANEVPDNNEPVPLPVAVVHQRVQGW